VDTSGCVTGVVDHHSRLEDRQKPGGDRSYARQWSPDGGAGRLKPSEPGRNWKRSAVSGEPSSVG
jgi:hypothetical protein